MSKLKPAFTLFLSLVIPLFANLISPLSSFAQTEETLTITTYYPAPYGVYNEMRAKKMGIGDNYYQAGSYPITGDTDLIVEGNVGIGTVIPQAKLDVAGGIKADGKIKIGDDSSAPTAGAIRWTGSDLEVYDGTEWKSLTAKSEGGLPFYGTDHTKQDCQNAGGMVADYQTNSFCKFTASSCPSGWTRYQNLGSTSSNTCQSFTHDNNCISSCTTGSHNFTNIPAETCSYSNWAFWSGGKAGQCIYQQSSTCTANVIEVECY